MVKFLNTLFLDQQHAGKAVGYCCSPATLPKVGFVQRIIKYGMNFLLYKKPPLENVIILFLYFAKLVLTMQNKEDIWPAVIYHSILNPHKRITWDENIQFQKQRMSNAIVLTLENIRL